MVDKAMVRNEIKPPNTNSSKRTVDLQPIARKALVSQLQLRRGSYAFYNPVTTQPWQNDWLLRNKYWYPALVARGRERRNPYQTRHTYASLLLMDGRYPLYVADQMGHSDWGMIRKVYGRFIR